MIPPDQMRFGEYLQASKLNKFHEDLFQKLHQKYTDSKHGNFVDWQSKIESLPNIIPSYIDFSLDVPVIGNQSDCSTDQLNQIRNTLMTLSPWRKGPLEIFGIYIDSEWRSDWKWARIAPHITSLENKIVLDVGCGNGYYALRMQAMGAEFVIGIDPTWLFVFQFLSIQKYIENIQRTFALPFALEELPDKITGFDNIFSMGVLYHRKEPVDHLQKVFDMLSQNGQFILETLVITDDKGKELIPKDRYANMRNVWKIPSCTLLKNWLNEVGFVEVEIIDITKTTCEEQRKTKWMKGFSLQEALDPCNSDLTIEGYPAPIRACVIANKS